LVVDKEVDGTRLITGILDAVLDRELCSFGIFYLHILLVLDGDDRPRLGRRHSDLPRIEGVRRQVIARELGRRHADATPVPKAHDGVVPALENLADRLIGFEPSRDERMALAPLATDATGGLNPP